ncbi:MAG: hypothetical protein QOE90_1647 [Thermoplasmata archaeon]|nr:hypothetical protein [Thermoplasmata archaeon]
MGALAGATLAALLCPWPVAAALLAAALAAGPQRRLLALFAAPALVVNALVVALVGGSWAEGAIGGLRLAAAVGVNLALLGRVGAARLAEGLRLPPRATAWAAAILLAAHDIKSDFERLRLARELEGGWPRGRLARAREAARLLPALTVAAHRRAQARRDALQLAGHAMPAWFVPVVAVAALGAAGRLAFLALPNVALTYAVVFLGGVLWGSAAGALGGALAMLVTDLMLTGFYPPGFVNVPAMALLGLGGAAMRRVDWTGPAGAMLAASTGIVATFAFSAASDVATWALFLRTGGPSLAALVALGLAFNAIPALANGALFALSVGPCVRAHEALRRSAPRPRAPTSPRASPGARSPGGSGSASEAAGSTTASEPGPEPAAAAPGS